MSHQSTNPAYFRRKISRWRKRYVRAMILMYASENHRTRSMYDEMMQIMEHRIAEAEKIISKLEEKTCSPLESMVT